MKTRIRQSIAVIGGGIAGLSIAWRLAASGCDVRLIEASAHASSSGGGTWASAGMICAELEMQGAPAPLAAFALGARAAWPAFAAEIERASGLGTGYAECGALHAHFADKPPTHGSNGLERLDGAGVRLLEPALSPEVSGAHWAPREAMADPRWTALALMRACQLAGVSAATGIRVNGLIEKGGRVVGLRSAHGSQTFDHVVLAAGAWSGELLGVSGLPGPHLRPVKGQVLSLSGQKSIGPSRIVWTDEVYVAPHQDGRIIVGATQEEAGFDTRLDNGRLDSLKAAAIRVLPALAGLRELERSFGFRPASDDALPVIGGIGLQGLTLASGQFRNGIMFAPLIADAASQHVLGNRLPDIAMPFSAMRFVEEAA
jgi:glycine oxidase